MMERAGPLAEGAPPRDGGLAFENEKLHRINQALMDRVERSMDLQGGAFSLFQTAIVLESKVRDRTRELEQTLRELESSNVALAAAKAVADDANASKTRFLAAAGHDLLQPLNAARLFVSALTDQPLGAEARRLLDQTNTALLSVEDLLEGLLEISKFDAGVVRPHFTHFPLNDVLASLATEYSAVARERGLKFKVLPCDVVVRSDMRMLRRVLQNFISNALRYTRSGGVLVGCRRRGQFMRIEVVDTGPGIPADKLVAIFQEFPRLEADSGQAAAAGDRGMGLGLAIVERAGRALDHRIDVRSVVGRGSAFAIEAPLGRRAQVLVKPAAQPAVGSKLSGALILVIDNDLAILDGMAALLHGWNCDVLVAADGRAALEAVDPARPPQIVIADYHLADHAIGFDALEAVAGCCTPRPAELIITADRSQAVHDLARLRGAAILTKPVKPARLRALISTLLP